MRARPGAQILPVTGPVELEEGVLGGREPRVSYPRAAFPSPPGLAISTHICTRMHSVHTQCHGHEDTLSQMFCPAQRQRSRTLALRPWLLSVRTRAEH